MTFSGACQNAADVPGIGGRRLETCRRSGGRVEVVCCMRYIELGGAVRGGSGRRAAEGLVPALCGLVFRKLVVFLFLFGRLLRWVV